jgi:RNA polymerase sigma-70 factor (ECF subfamily)
MTTWNALVTEMAPSTHCTDGSDVSRSRFTEAYRANFVHLYRFLERLGVHPGDVEDVCHEVFLVFHRKMMDVQPGVSDRAYLLGIGARAAADYRRLKRHGNVPLAHGASEHASSHPEAIYTMRRELAQALARLDDDARAVLVMHELEGLTVPEIAVIVSVPLNTVYSRLRLARAAFERAVAETEPASAQGHGGRANG